VVLVLVLVLVLVPAEQYVLVLRVSCREAPNAAVWYGPVDLGLTCNWPKVMAHFVSVRNCTLCLALLAVRLEVKRRCVWGRRRQSVCDVFSATESIV
jgi:hypothetical protein